MTLHQAVKEVLWDGDLKAKYPKGMNAIEVLTEIRAKHGVDAFPYCSVIDVADELKRIFL